MKLEYDKREIKKIKEIKEIKTNVLVFNSIFLTLQ